MNYKSIIALFSVLFSFFQGFAQSADKSWLWEIKLPNSTHVSHLFGTIHIIGEEDFVLDQTVINQFNKADLLITEVDLSNKKSIQAASLKAILDKDHPIEKIAGAKLYKKLEEIFLLQWKMSAMEWTVMKMMKPLFWTSTIMNKLLDHPHSGYDIYFSESALHLNKPMVGLETMDEAMQAVDKIPLKDQYEYYAKEMYNLDTAKKDVRELIAVYKSADVEVMQNLMKEGMMEMQSSEKHLLDDRNSAWLDDIEKHIAIKNCFIAVGAGHLGGEKGLIKMLQNKGYTVTRIEH